MSHFKTYESFSYGQDDPPKRVAIDLRSVTVVWDMKGEHKGIYHPYLSLRCGSGRVEIVADFDEFVKDWESALGVP